MTTLEPSGDRESSTLADTITSDASRRSDGTIERRVTVIDRFLILEKLGEGGMGVVYAAFDPELDRRVAIKLLRPQSSGDEHTATIRLKREAQAMAKLSHPNVVPVYDVGAVENSVFVAMEFVAGTTLANWLIEERRQWREVLSMFVQAGRGLEAAHAAGVVHRDFKPSNVLLGKDGRARVSDFGLARTEGSGPKTQGQTRDDRSGNVAAHELTQSGVILGSPGYMSPEQYRGEPASAAADQFSFCIALYEGLYGTRPFRGGSLEAIAELASSGEVPPPPKDSSVPPWLFEVVKRGLAPRPEARHPSMSALLALLEDDPPARRRRRLAWAGVSLVGAAIVAAVGLAPRFERSACASGSTTLTNEWEAQRGELERAFLATGLAYAPVSWEQSRSRLTDYTKDWAVEFSRACAETLTEGTRTRRQLDLRQRCLERRRTEFKALAARLSRADATLVERAVVATSRLTPVSRCADLASLESRAHQPPDVQATSGHLEEQAAQGRVLATLGRADDARTMLEAAVLQARELGDPQTLGVVLLELGALEWSVDRYPESRKALEEATEQSLRGHDDRTALEGVARLVSLLGWRLEQPKEALALFPIGAGLLPRVADPGLEAMLYRGLGDACFQLGDGARTTDAFERALAAIGRDPHPDPLEAARVRGSLGLQQLESGHVAKALEYYRQARRDRESALGAEHPALAASYGELAVALEALDDLEGARQGLVEMQQVWKRQKRPPGVKTFVTDLNLARVLAAMGRGEEALTLIAGVEPSLGPELPAALGVELFHVKGSAFRAARRLDEAEAAMRESLRRALELFGPEHSEIAEVSFLLGGVLLEQHRPKEALEAIDRAEKIHQASKSVESLQYAGLGVDRAAALAGLAGANQWPVALAAAEEAVRRAELQEGNAALKARAWLQVAEAQWRLGRTAEARDAAEKARGFAQTSRPIELERVQQWCDAHR